MDGCGCSNGLGTSAAHCEFQNLGVLDSMVVVTSSHRCRSPGSNPRRSLINFILLPGKGCVETMGEGYSKVLCGECQLSFAE